MFKGQKFFRFKVEFVDGKAQVTKHTFEIVDCRERLIVGKPCLEFRPRCVEDCNIKFKDGYYREEADFDFGKVRPSGKAVYAALEEDNEKEALRLIQIYMKDKVEQLNRKLRQVEEELNMLESLL